MLFSSWRKTAQKSLLIATLFLFRRCSVRVQYQSILEIIQAIPARLDFVAYVGFQRIWRHVSRAKYKGMFEGRLLTYSLTQTLAYGSAACGTLQTARSINPLVDRMKPATSLTPFVILDTLKILAQPSSTSLLIYICRLVGLQSSAEMLVLEATPGLAPRTVSNVSIYDMTSSALSALRLSYATFQSLSVSRIKPTRSLSYGGARARGVPSQSSPAGTISQQEGHPRGSAPGQSQYKMGAPLLPSILWLPRSNRSNRGDTTR